MSHQPAKTDSWLQLRRFTAARIALGRAGDSLPTEAMLHFALDHARARDAVHQPLAADRLCAELAQAGFPVALVDSAAADRSEYLRRPDLGRQLAAASRDSLVRLRSVPAPEVVFIIGDGLSAKAVEAHALPLLQALETQLSGWRLGPLVVARQARVALGDEIGELLDAEQVVVLIGERPGLSSPDSLGVYLTYGPRIGRHDAERNCISNVRGGGLGYGEAAHKLLYLLREARRLRLSGVGLKDESPALAAGV